MRFIRNYSPIHDVMISDFLNRGVSDFIGSDSLNSYPAVNIWEKPEHFLIQLAVPGLTKADFKIEFEKGQLVVSAKKEEQKIEEGTKFNRREFNYSSFQRSFKLPESADAENINATYENGVLELKVGKKEDVKLMPKKIAVN
ncbi:MAG: Hsp20/alpha crystallin family protein [Saprospiraceae bacterium]